MKCFHPLLPKCLKAFTDY